MSLYEVGLQCQVDPNQKVELMIKVQGEDEQDAVEEAILRANVTLANIAPMADGLTVTGIWRLRETLPFKTYDLAGSEISTFEPGKGGDGKFD